MPRPCASLRGSSRGSLEAMDPTERKAIIRAVEGNRRVCEEDGLPAYA